jgi:hypothetical protein
MVGCVAMMRRWLGLLAAAPLVAALTGCDSSNSDALRLGTLAYQQLGHVFGDDNIPRARVVAIPYATIGVRLGGGAESLLVLAGISQHDLQWLGGTTISITTRDGRIIRTVGLEHNLDGFQGPVADKPGAASGQGAYHYIYDLIDRNTYGVFVRCTQSDTGAEAITIIGVHHDTRHIVEHCEAPQLDWTFQNDFWTDAATGYVWKTTQYVHPDLDPLTIQILRPEKG